MNKAEVIDAKVIAAKVPRGNEFASADHVPDFLAGIAQAIVGTDTIETLPWAGKSLGPLSQGRSEEKSTSQSKPIGRSTPDLKNPPPMTKIRPQAPTGMGREVGR